MVTFKMSHESALARSSNILLPCPPKSRTPLPSGDSAIARPSPVTPLGKDGPVIQNNQIVFFL